MLFGFPGGMVIPFYDALLDAKKLRHVLVRHEQGAGHAADGYARATGRVGVAWPPAAPAPPTWSPASPPPTWTRSPWSPSPARCAADLIGTDAFQEADITGITLPIIKHNYLVKDVADLPRIVHEAFHIAAHRPPRPRADRHPDRTCAPGEVDYRSRTAVDLPGYKPTVHGPRQADPSGGQGASTRPQRPGALRWAAA